MFDTRDYNTIASDASSKISKQDTLLQLNLTVNEKAMRCDQKYDRAFYVLKGLIEELDAIHSTNQTDGRRAEEEAEIADDLAYYEVEMLQTTAQAIQCQDDASHPMRQHDKQQQQQRVMKPMLYSETKGGKKHSTKSEHIY
ncbi:hypothetical protein D1007_42152 [Hordeum vulgare]|nr:hypothetical protein D1007_42152 [Hordeum vulgare]